MPSFACAHRDLRNADWCHSRLPRRTKNYQRPEDEGALQFISSGALLLKERQHHKFGSQTADPRQLSLQQLMDSYAPGNEATMPRGSDPKWRYFWKLRWPSDQGAGEAPGADTEQVIPEGFPVFEETMEKWGNSMLQAVATVAKLLALGYGLEEDTFKDMLLDGRHLLAPTGVCCSASWSPCHCSALSLLHGRMNCGSIQ